MDPETTQMFADVWDALENDSETAANLRLRSELMIAIADVVGGWRATKSAAAARLGIASPDLARLIAGEIDAFPVDALVSIADRAGLSVEIRIARRAA